MIKSIYMIYALLLALLLTGVIATDLSDHFVTFPGARSVGGCDADKEKLQNAYKEAHKLVDNAVKSLNSLSKRRPHFSADEVSLSDSIRTMIYRSGTDKLDFSKLYSLLIPPPRMGCLLLRAKAAFRRLCVGHSRSRQNALSNALF